MDVLDRRMIHVPGAPNQVSTKFHYAIQIVHDLKLMHCLFLNFPLIFSDHSGLQVS